MVEIEKLEGGAFRVSRVFPNAASMQAGASALERIVPEAYEPVQGYTRVDVTTLDGPATIELRD